MAENNVNIEIRNDFNQIFGIISYHRQRVSKTIDDESLRMIWEVGGYISHKLKNAEWGAGIVRQLSEFIKERKIQPSKDGAIVRYIKWCNFMIPIVLIRSANC